MEPIDYLNCYLYFLWNYATPDMFEEMFKNSYYNHEYMFNEVWVNRSNTNPASFWANLDSGCREIVFNFAVNFMKNKL